MSSPAPFILREQLGLQYTRAVIAVNAPRSAALFDESTGNVYPVQYSPTTPFDRTTHSREAFIVADIKPAQTLSLLPASPSRIPVSTAVHEEGDYLIITNGKLRARVARHGWWDPPFPGPIPQFSFANGPWLGDSRVHSSIGPSLVETVVESIGPCLIQWRTTVRFGNQHRITTVIRWPAGSDTLQVHQETFDDTDAFIDWTPLTDAQPFVWGGGEQLGPMKPLAYKSHPDARKIAGQRRLGHIGHLGYWNQWCYVWTAMTSRSAASEAPCVGLFSALGSTWQHRGYQRPQIFEDDATGAFFRLPIRKGTRAFGIVVSTRSGVGVDDSTRRNLLNIRKREISDLPIAKVRSWNVGSPSEGGIAVEPRAYRIIPPDLAAETGSRIVQDARILAILQAYPSQPDHGKVGMAAVSMALGEKQCASLAVEQLLDFAARTLREVALGGYERLIIFDGRSAKRFSYDLDHLWAAGLIAEADYLKVRRTMLALAYMFADPDYNLPDDYYQTEPDSGIRFAMDDEMGDCPVPPNFFSEFFTTTGLVAELFSTHPMAGEWRSHAIEHTRGFLDRFFTPDGVYAESILYHNHSFCELLTCLFAQWVRGSANFFSDPRIIGSFRHFIHVTPPATTNGTPAMDSPSRVTNKPHLCDTFANWDSPARAFLLNNGNSGYEAYYQSPGSQFSIGAYVYRDSDPDLSAQLMFLWHRSGRLILEHVAPTLTLATLDPTLPVRDPKLTSNHRKSLGVVSRTSGGPDFPIFAFFRAGSATHHMDYDQGHVDLVAGDKILLGDYGYHAHDSEHNGIPCYGTWIHSTVNYSMNRHLASGYAGLERAPEPRLVHLGDTFDWVVHTIVNHNLRDTRIGYNRILPAPATLHHRHYLFAKSGYILLWDTFEAPPDEAVFWLHPFDPVHQIDDTTFAAGDAEQTHLWIQFLAPDLPRVIENQRHGRLWSFGVALERHAPCLTLLAPVRANATAPYAHYDAGTNTIHVAGTDFKHRIALPSPGSTEALPRFM